MITVIGSGTEEGELTLSALKALREADEVLVRTGGIACVKSLKSETIPFETLDHLYERSRNYDTLARKLAAEVKRRGKEKNVCYVVDGSAGEDACAQILLKSRGVTLLDGRSKASAFAALASVGGDFTAVSAFSVEGRNLSLPLVVYDLTEDNIGDVKLCLAERYGDETPVLLIKDGKAKKMPLFEIDREKVAPMTGVVVPEQPLLTKKRFGFEDVVAILKRLRAPDGCPWDRVQTHESIRINAIEEAYELVDAIDQKDPDRMCEEAGDVLMQSLFHTLIEEEKGNFTVADMLTELCTKLITRHTHVFGEDRAATADGALSVWEKNKMTEKRQHTYSDAVNDVPPCFPALLRAQKIAKRTEKGGWDAATFENFERKFREEYNELKEAVKAGEEAHIAEELGDVLFCTVELGRAAGADCEMALLDTVKKMQARFTAYERLVLADGKDMNALSPEEKDEYYRRAKDDTRA